jgi:hypothetical protein
VGTNNPTENCRDWPGPIVEKLNADSRTLAPVAETEIETLEAVPEPMLLTDKETLLTPPGSRGDWAALKTIDGTPSMFTEMAVVET